MDGKTGAEELIAKVIKDPALLKSLADARKTNAPEQQDPTHRGDQTMAEEAVNPGSALQGIEYQGNEFASLLKKEFKPKSDDAKSAVEQAVLTLAQQALAQTNADRQRRRSCRSRR